MIEILKLRIQEFRGIRDLALDLDGSCYAVWGPNGTGKSGVVDAVDFLLTGDIARLKGGGSGGVSLVKHGPHVKKRDDAGSAIVSGVIRDTTSGESASVTRSVKNPKVFSLEPESMLLREAITRAGEHPELVLSRREIIKYIVATPGDRSTEVQALLKLERISALRSSFRSAKTKAASALKAAESNTESARQAVSRLLDAPEIRAPEVLGSVNKLRTVLALPPLDVVDLTTNVAEGAEKQKTQTQVDRTAALADLAALEQVVDSPGPWVADFEALEAAFEPLDSDPQILDVLKKRVLFESGLGQVDDRYCPLCGLEWPDEESLRSHLEAAIQRSGDALAVRQAIVDAGGACATRIGSTLGLAGDVRRAGDAVGEDGIVANLDGWTTRLSHLRSALATMEGAISSRTQLASNPLALTEELASSIRDLRSALEALPDQSDQSAAASSLTLFNERWSVLRAATLAESAAKDVDEMAAAVYRNYCDAQDQGLALLYQTVQERFAEFYRVINSDDEADFKASLEPSAQKLDLLVDFYGEGLFPPVAYHSEGHQDGMGLCLYLALMENLLGDEFRLAVLDDVVMSVDTNHRKEFCNLLSSYFPDVQFIITTHDELWARQMQKSGLVSKKNQVQFLRWTVEDGPLVMEGSDFWDRISADLENNNVPGAAARLRRNLESLLGEIAEDLQGMVPYRVVGGPDLGELLDAVRGRYGKLLGQAAAAANSWGNDELAQKVASAKEQLTTANLVQSREQWAVNPAVHYNAWANFSPQDFGPVVEACRSFIDLFRCPTCEAMIHISRSNGADESLRCKCGEIQFDLIKR